MNTTTPFSSSSTSATSNKAVFALVFGILGIVGTLPIVGPLLAIGCGIGERSGVGRAGLCLGGITLALYLLVAFLVAVGLFGFLFLLLL